MPLIFRMKEQEVQFESGIGTAFKTGSATTNIIRIRTKLHHRKTVERWQAGWIREKNGMDLRSTWAV